MFEEFYASWRQQQNLSEADLERFNCHLEDYLTCMELDPVIHSERAAWQAKHLGTMYLTEDPATWPF